MDKSHQPYFVCFFFFLFFWCVFFCVCLFGFFLARLEKYFIQRYISLFGLSKMRKVIVSIKDHTIEKLAEYQNSLFIGFLVCSLSPPKMYSIISLYTIACVAQMELSDVSTCCQNPIMNKILCMWIIYKSKHRFIFSWRSWEIEGECQWSCKSRKSIPCDIRYIFLPLCSFPLL